MLLIAGAPAIASAAPCEKADAAPTRAALVDDTHVVACYGRDTCWHFDLAARTWSEGASLPPAPPDPPPPTGDPQTFSTTLRVCGADHKDCRELSVANLAPINDPRVVYNEDRSIAALLGTEPMVTTFDAKTEKPLATIRGWKTSMPPPLITAAYLTGDTLIVFVHYSPVSSQGRLFDARTGKRIAGAGDGGEIEEDIVDLGRDRRLFRKFDSDALLVQNTRTGRVLQTLQLGAPRSRNALHAATFLLAQTAEHGLLVAMRGDVESGLIVYDPKANKQTRYPVPTCK